METPSYFYPQITTLLDESAAAIRQAIEHKRRAKDAVTRPKLELIDWAERHFYIPATGVPIVFQPHQKAILKLAFNRTAQGHLPYRTFLYSTIKQSGKSTIAALILRWYAETGQRHSELYCVGNDKEQAKTRSFREIRRSLELTPGFDSTRDRLPGEWVLLKESMRCLTTGTEIKALAVDAKGEAGGKPALQTYTELWGFDQEEAIRFWDELTPIPTIPDSMRIVETYAGYVQESTLLEGLYNNAMQSHQLTAGELADRTNTPLGTFAEAQSPDDLIPIWEDPIASQLTYWDTGLAARRMPWQLDVRGADYYREQEASLPPNSFRRLHRNEWTSSESDFIRPEVWDGCYDPEAALPLYPGDRTPIVLGVDAATTGDCFAIVAVSRHPTRHDDVAVRAVRVWDPKDSGGVVDYAQPDAFIRLIARGGCTARHPRSQPDPTCEFCQRNEWTIEPHNVVQVAYDPFQLEEFMQRMRRDQIAWCEPFSQASDRLKSDRALYDAILTRRLAHNGDQRLREHILNAGAKLQTDADSTLRIVKRSQNKKIDAAVSLSMASYRCKYLNI